MPSTDSSTGRDPRAARSVSSDEVSGFQLMGLTQPAVGDGGIARLAENPATAIITSPSATAVVLSGPAASVPNRMARKVPACTIPLPPINSAECNICGSMPYLAGATNVECSPIKDNALRSQAI